MGPAFSAEEPLQIVTGKIQTTHYKLGETKEIKPPSQSAIQKMLDTLRVNAQIATEGDEDDEDEDGDETPRRKRAAGSRSATGGVSGSNARADRDGKATEVKAKAAEKVPVRVLVVTESQAGQLRLDVENMLAVVRQVERTGLGIIEELKLARIVPDKDDGSAPKGTVETPDKAARTPKKPAKKAPSGRSSKNAVLTMPDGFVSLTDAATETGLGERRLRRWCDADKVSGARFEPVSGSRSVWIIPAAQMAPLKALKGNTPAVAVSARPASRRAADTSKTRSQRPASRRRVTVKK